MRMFEILAEAVIVFLLFFLTLGAIIRIVDYSVKYFVSDSQSSAPQTEIRENPPNFRGLELMHHWKSKHPKYMDPEEVVILRCNKEKAQELSEAIVRFEGEHKNLEQKGEFHEKLAFPSKLPSKFTRNEITLQYDKSRNLFAILSMSNKKQKKFPVKVYYADPFFYFTIRF